MTDILLAPAPPNASSLRLRVDVSDGRCWPFTLSAPTVIRMLQTRFTIVGDTAGTMQARVWNADGTAGAPGTLLLTAATLPIPVGAATPFTLKTVFNPGAGPQGDTPAGNYWVGWFIAGTPMDTLIDLAASDAQTYDAARWESGGWTVGTGDQRRGDITLYGEEL